MYSKDKERFFEYRDKLQVAMYKANLNESVVTGYGLLNRKKVAIGVMDSNFMMGSMGKVVGEKITRLIEFATKEAIIKSINEQVLLSDIEVFLENNELKCRYKNYKIKVSIAHEKNMAIGFAICED